MKKRNIISVSQILAISCVDDILHIEAGFIKRSGKKNHRVYDNAVALDIEVSSFYDGEAKKACMYVWSFMVNDIFIYGRTWPEYVDFINKLKAAYQLNKDKKLIIYVHNLSYEFQFIKCWFEWSTVFCLKEYDVLKAIDIDEGIEYKCSYKLSGMSLDMLAKSLTTIKIKKFKGDLDYNLNRHCQTPLTDEEFNYIYNDVAIVCAYIKEQIAQYKYIWKIPLTNTGRVRQFCKDGTVYYQGKRKKYLNRSYRYLISTLTLEPHEYDRLKEAFQGGFTHGNLIYNGQILKDVTSFDFTSSYPAVMVCEKYPMSKGQLVKVSSVKELEDLFNEYCVMMYIRYTNIKEKPDVYENYLPQHKCQFNGDYQINNGKVIKAEQLTTCITDRDYLIVKAFYDYDSIQLGEVWIYEKQYLPKEFVKCVIDLYKDKTTLKDVEEKAKEYLLKKSMLNSCYGMAVTDIVRAVITLTEEGYEKTLPDVSEVVDKYNNTFDRFLYYPWGVWVTAYARYNLFTAIWSCDNDYIYTDTDSIKLINYPAHEAYFKAYNAQNEEKMIKALKYNGIEPEAYKPSTIKGEVKPLGVWDFDGFYNYFKFLGAKRYMTMKRHLIGPHGTCPLAFYHKIGVFNCAWFEEYTLTVAGLSKTLGLKEIIRQAESTSYRDIFNVFKIGLKVGSDQTGKNTHTYIEEHIKGELIDYRGIKGPYEEKSYIHLEPTPFEMSISEEYEALIAELNGRIEI